jgi:glycosyltransferase involved in cell wall biosynthesis
MIRVAVVVPYFNHEHAIAQTAQRLASHRLACIVVDDGSSASARAALDAVGARESQWLRIERHAENRGKGQAVLTGIRSAAAAGATHALQIDADGQHDFADIPRMVELARTNPAAIIVGVPVFDETVPTARRIGRKVTTLWVGINTLSRRIEDGMCGFRIYPVAEFLAIAEQEGFGSRMEFDPEILVRAVWRNIPLVSFPTRVTYPLDGVSHFKMWRDNVRISWMHTRLFFGMLWRLPRLLWQRLNGR